MKVLTSGRRAVPVPKLLADQGVQVLVPGEDVAAVGKIAAHFLPGLLRLREECLHQVGIKDRQVPVFLVQAVPADPAAPDLHPFRAFTSRVVLPYPAGAVIITALLACIAALKRRRRSGAMITLGGCGMISLLRMMGMPSTVILSYFVL